MYCNTQKQHQAPGSSYVFYVRQIEQAFFPWRICKHKRLIHLSSKIETCSNCKVDDGGKEHSQRQQLLL